MSDCEGKCVNEKRIAAIETDMERNSKQHREFYNKIHEQDKEMAVSDTKYENLCAMVSRVEDAVNKLENSVTELKDKPAKKWETVAASSITAIVGAIIGFFINSML